MMVLRSVLSSLALIIAPMPIAGAHSNAGVEEHVDIDIIEATELRDDRYTVPVSIEGVGPFRFLVDTGAQATVVTGNVVSKLGPLERGTATLVGMAGRKSVETVEFDNLTLGNRTFNNITAPLLLAANIGADGILGLDSLQAQRILINFRDDTLTVSDARSQGGNRGFEIVVRARRKIGQLIITDARVEGVRTAVIIDTGSQSSVGNLALNRALRKKSEYETVMTDVTGTQLEGRSSLASSIDIENVAMKNIMITYAEAPVFQALGLEKRPALILGMGDLRLFDRVAIDFSTGQILFDIPGSSRASRTGFLD